MRQLRGSEGLKNRGKGEKGEEGGRWVSTKRMDGWMGLDIERSGLGLDWIGLQVARLEMCN